jgi:hypothetical protein
MGVMEVQIRGPRPESNAIVPVARAGVDGPVVQSVPVPMYSRLNSNHLRLGKQSRIPSLLTGHRPRYDQAMTGYE